MLVVQEEAMLVVAAGAVEMPKRIAKANFLSIHECLKLPNIEPLCVLKSYCSRAIKREMKKHRY